MGLPLYLAMTAAELSAAEALPEKMAYMACHFSPYGTGLSNIPEHLPESSLLILNDRTPVQGHDPALVARQLAQAAEELQPAGILLDLQRPGEPQTPAIVEAILNTLSCPVAVSPDYAHGHACPVFLEPPPLHSPLEGHIAPWQDREIWLEAALEAESIAITAAGSVFEYLPFENPDGEYHIEEKLCCRYQLRLGEGQADFTLLRGAEDLAALLAQADKLGVTRAVGLYQQLGKITL